MSAASDKRKAKLRRHRRRMQAIDEQAARERKAREPAPEPQPKAKEAEIIDVPGLVRAPARPELPDDHPLRILARMAPLMWGG